MRYVAAYLLATLGSKSNPSKQDIQSILESVGLDVDDEKLSKVCSELQGKDINEVISEGMGKLASMPSGMYSSYILCGVCPLLGGVPCLVLDCASSVAYIGGAVAVASSAAGGGGDSGAAEEKEETKVEEEEEESDDDMGFGLFD